MSHEKLPGIEDSLRRDDLKPEVQPSRKRLRAVLWMVLFGGARMHSKRLYPPARAKRIAMRFNRLYRTDIAYADRFGRV